MTSEAIQIAEKIQIKLQDFRTFDVSVLNSHIEADKEHIIHEELFNIPEPLKSRIEAEFFGYGPLRSLIDDPSVTEIIVNRSDFIWYERNGVFQRHDDQFLTDTSYQNFIQRISRWMHGQTTLDKPFLCETIGDLRIHISGSAVTEGSALLSIRKHKESAWTLKEFSSINWASERNIETIKSLIQKKKNMLVIGPTGTGKTSLLNAVMAEVKENERILILEDTNELRVPNTCSTKILTREDSQNILAKIDLSDLLRQALRMRPDRIVIGEIRGMEAKDLLLALSTGHAGSLGTLHASHPQEALLRLEMLIQLGAPQWSLEAIRKLIFISIQNLIVLGFNENRERVLKGIYKLSGMESFGITLDPLGDF